MPQGQHSVRVGNTPHMVTPSPDISCSTSRELTRYRVGLGTRLKRALQVR